MSTEDGHHGIQPAVIVQISKRQSPTRHWSRDSRFRAFEPSIMNQSEQRRL